MTIIPYVQNDQPDRCALSTSCLHPVDNHLIKDMASRLGLRQVWVLVGTDESVIGAFNTKQDAVHHYTTLTKLPYPHVTDIGKTTLPGKVRHAQKRPGLFGRFRKRLFLVDGA